MALAAIPNGQEFKSAMGGTYSDGWSTKGCNPRKDIKAPKHVSDEDFETICRTFAIGKSDAKPLREFLVLFVDEFSRVIHTDRLLPDLRADRDTLQKVLGAIRATQRTAAKRIGPGAHRGLRAMGSSIGPALSARWLREQFSGDDFAPQKQDLFEHYPGPQGVRPQAARIPARFPVWAMRSRLDVEEMSIDARILCVSKNPLETTVALLNLLELGLTQALGEMLLLPGARGGRHPLNYRKYGLVNLAHAWNHQLGRRPTSGANSQFLAFSEAIFEVIGWPKNGLASALPDAIALWKNRDEKFSR